MEEKMVQSDWNGIMNWLAWGTRDITTRQAKLYSPQLMTNLHAV